jgi:hypothetical protein
MGGGHRNSRRQSQWLDIALPVCFVSTISTKALCCVALIAKYRSPQRARLRLIANGERHVSLIRKSTKEEYAHASSRAWLDCSHGK